MLVEDSNFVVGKTCGDVAPLQASSMTKLHCHQQFTRNERLLNQRKIKSRNAARNRRGKENLEFYELAKLLPIPGELSCQLDKASIIRLTMSFLKIREFCNCNRLLWKRLNDGPPPNRTVKDASNAASLTPQQTQLEKVFCGQEGSLILQSLDGFMFVLNYKGQLIYVSEAISVFLGLSQVEMIGSSIFDYVYPEDRNELAFYLSQTLTRHSSKLEFRKGLASKDSIGCLTIRMKSTLAKKGISPKSSSFKVVRISTRVQETSICLSEVDNFSHAASKQEISSDQKSLTSSNPGIMAFGSILPPDEFMDGHLSQDSIVTRVNAALQFSYCESHVQKLLGYEVREVIGQSLYHCIHVADAERMKKCHAELLVKGHIETPYFRWLHKSGGYRWVSATIMAMPNQRLYPDQSFMFVHTIISDIFDGDHLLDLHQIPLKGAEGHRRRQQIISEPNDNSMQAPEKYQGDCYLKPNNAQNIEEQSQKVVLRDSSSIVDDTDKSATILPSATSISAEAEKLVAKEQSFKEDLEDCCDITDGQIRLQGQNRTADSSHENGISLLCMAQEWAHYMKHRPSLQYADFVSEYMDVDSNYWSNPPNKEVSNHNDLPPGAKKMHGLVHTRRTPSVVHHHYPIRMAPPLLHASPLVAKFMAAHSAQWCGVRNLTESRTLVLTTPVTMVPQICVPTTVCSEKISGEVSSGEEHTPASVAATLEELKKDPLHKLNPPNKVVSSDQRGTTSKFPPALECQHRLLSFSKSVSPCQGPVCVISQNAEVQLSGKTETKSISTLKLCPQHILKSRVAGSAVFQVPSTVLVPATGVVATGAKSAVISHRILVCKFP